MNKCPPRPVQRHELCSEQEAAAEAAGMVLPMQQPHAKWRRVLEHGKWVFRNEETGAVEEEVPDGDLFFESF